MRRSKAAQAVGAIAELRGGVAQTWKDNARRDASPMTTARWVALFRRHRCARMRSKSDRSERMFYDWGGGLVWVALSRGRPMPGRVCPRRCATGGHATLVRAPAADPRRVPVSSRRTRPSRLTTALKDSYRSQPCLGRGELWAEYRCRPPSTLAQLADPAVA